MSSQNQHHVLVLGAGNFGTCLGQHLADIGHRVTMWSQDEKTAATINKTHKNPNYLSEFILSERLQATNKISENLAKTISAIVISVPTQAIRQVLEKWKRVLPRHVTIICAAKGIDIETLKLPQGIIAEVLGENVGQRATILSGPSFAIEVIHKMPTAVTIGGFVESECIVAQELFHANHFRVYRSNDPIGLQVAGALKNVIAIAAGAAAGIGLQANSRAALLTRGLAEMTRVGVAMGANPLTFNGLGGVGDLFLTCTSEKSRNFTLGLRIGRGEPIKKIISTIASVAEGYYTTKAAHALSESLGVSTPICDQVFDVLYKEKPIKDALSDLLMREATVEVDLDAPRTNY